MEEFVKAFIGNYGKIVSVIISYENIY